MGKRGLTLEMALVSVGLGPVFLAPKSRFMVGNGGFGLSEKTSAILGKQMRGRMKMEFCSDNVKFGRLLSWG